MAEEADGSCAGIGLTGRLSAHGWWEGWVWRGPASLSRGWKPARVCAGIALLAAVLKLPECVRARVQSPAKRRSRQVGVIALQVTRALILAFTMRSA
jgi:hypothetical protein